MDCVVSCYAATMASSAAPATVVMLTADVVALLAACTLLVAEVVLLLVLLLLVVLAVVGAGVVGAVVVAITAVDGHSMLPTYTDSLPDVSDSDAQLPAPLIDMTLSSGPGTHV